MVLSDGDAELYTRAGNFHLDANSRLVNGQGFAVQGFALDAAGNAVAGASDIDFSSVSASAVETTRLDISNNLSADAQVVVGGFDGSSFAAAYGSSNYATTTKVFDSLGRSHEMTLFFTKTGANAWEVNVGVNGEVLPGNPAGLQIMGTTGVTFDGTGALTAPAPLDIAVTFDGAAAQTVGINLGTPSTTPGDGRVRHSRGGNSGGLESIIGSAIERANVELAKEFVDLISLQRSFQANARVVTTSDGLLNELINIVR